MDSSLRASYTNAFTKNELVVISCLIAYPGLSFCNIRQKTCKSISDGAVRGMAFVPVQLEDFFQRRLRFLGILDDVYHPKYMAGLSTVVLSSTYCYHQLGSWRYLTSWESASSLVLQLQNFPSFLSIDGVYVRVQHTFENVTKYGTCWVYAQVMSAKTGNALGIPKDMTKKISKGYARVLVFDSKSALKRGQEVQVSVFNFVSLGKGQADDPICVARFSISGSKLDRITEKCRFTAKDTHLEPFAPFKLEMISHLDCNGKPIYQTMFARGDPPRLHPVIQLFDLKSTANVDMEYGPDLILCRTPSAGFIPSSLREQGEHCDGNCYHAKGQWSD